MTAQDPILRDIGQRLQAVRKTLTVTQQDFARQVEVSGASLSAMEAGNSKPRIEVYFHLTREYNVNLEFLLHGQGEMFLNGEGHPEDEDLEKPGECREFMGTFLDYFDKSPVVRYAMMTHFTTFLEENEAIIEKNIKKNKLKPGGDDQ